MDNEIIRRRVEVIPKGRGSFITDQGEVIDFGELEQIVITEEGGTDRPSGCPECSGPTLQLWNSYDPIETLEAVYCMNGEGCGWREER